MESVSSMRWIAYLSVAKESPLETEGLRQAKNQSMVIIPPEAKSLAKIGKSHGTPNLTQDAVSSTVSASSGIVSVVAFMLSMNTCVSTRLLTTDFKVLDTVGTTRVLPQWRAQKGPVNACLTDRDVVRAKSSNSGTGQ